MKKHVATYMPVVGWGFPRRGNGKWQVVCRTCKGVGLERDSAREAAVDLSAHQRGELKLKPLITAK